MQQIFPDDKLGREGKGFRKHHRINKTRTRATGPGAGNTILCYLESCVRLVHVHVESNVDRLIGCSTRSEAQNDERILSAHKISNIESAICVVRVD